MAQQTQMSRVLPKFDEFVAAFATVDALAAASAGDVLRAWAPLGYNMRALRLHKAARQIVREGRFPRTAAELERIDGIGPFTAAIIASFAFGEPAAAIDTNVRRVVSRLLGDSDGALPDAAVRREAEALISRRAPGRWNQAMMDLGALVCTARAPRCGECPLARWCRARPLFAKRAALKRAAEPRAPYRTEPPFRSSRRYFRGRIVQALRELPPGRSLSPDALLERLRQAEARPSDGLRRAAFDELLASLRRDGLVAVTRVGRLRLP